RTQLKLTLGVEPRGMAAGRPEMSLPEAACPLDRLSDTVEEAEKSAVQKALEATGGNKRRAAKLLGVARSTFYEKLKKYHLA
ncbi:MAG: hypothetical protein H5T97_11780, partial [Firmicutes bacterium]|nr:hypothetical protein [Bacillota bacterium]